MPLLDEDDLRALLAEGGITALTIDTSIFDEKQLQSNSATLQVLARTKGRLFSFILSDTVAKEVMSHLEGAASEAFISASKGIGQGLRALVTKAPTRGQLLDQITGGRNPEQVAREHFDKMAYPFSSGHTRC